MQGRMAGGAGRVNQGRNGGSHVSGMTYTKGEGEQMGVLRKWWGPAHLLHPLSVWQSRVTPVVGGWGWGGGAGGGALGWWWLWQRRWKKCGLQGRKGRWGGCLH